MQAVPSHSRSTLPAPPAFAPGASPALFLDIDGTLLDFAPRHDAVRVEPGLAGHLVTLYERIGGALALVSGRPLAEIDALLAWSPRAAAGLHGAELRRADGSIRVRGDASAFAHVRELARVLASGTRITLEDKVIALALHFREAPEAEDAARTIAAGLLEEAGADFMLQQGNCVFEIKPRGADKGSAIAALMRDAPFAGRMPWMLGDDLTDEDAFAQVNALGGISVLIGSRTPSAARHRLADPAAVREWLRMLVDA